jgi:hypothetical protein
MTSGALLIWDYNDDYDIVIKKCGSNIIQYFLILIGALKSPIDILSTLC